MFIDILLSSFFPFLGFVLDWRWGLHLVARVFKLDISSFFYISLGTLIKLNTYTKNYQFEQPS